MMILIIVFHHWASSTETLKVSLDPSSLKLHIRKALNTNPTITNSAITSEAATRTYYQGGFTGLASLMNIRLSEPLLRRLVWILLVAMLLSITLRFYQWQLMVLTQFSKINWRSASTKLTTGWFISQDLSDNSGAYTLDRVNKAIPPWRL